jgi:hypothetical protein
MGNPIYRGQSGSQVAEWHPLSNKIVANQAPKIPILNPYGLPVRHTLHSTTITAVSTSGGTATFTAQNRYIVGQSVTISSALPAGYNGTYTITAATNTTFSVTNATTGAITTFGLVQLNTAPVIPSNITWLWAVCVGAGTGINSSPGVGHAGGVTAGWALANSSYTIGYTTSLTSGNFSFTRYGHLIAGGGGLLGCGGGGAANATGANYWGQLSGVSACINGAAGGYGGGQTTTSGAIVNGGNGISGGGGVAQTTATGTQTGGNGGNGFVGGGGGAANTGGLRTGGNGGSGYGIDGTIYTGGLGSTGTASAGHGGGGAGIAGNGLNATSLTSGVGGLGGGGGGGIAGSSGGYGGGGLIYLCY